MVWTDFIGSLYEYVYCRKYAFRSSSGTSTNKQLLDENYVDVEHRSALFLFGWCFRSLSIFVFSYPAAPQNQA